MNEGVAFQRSREKFPIDSHGQSRGNDALRLRQQQRQKR